MDKKDILVLKLGSSVLTNGTNRISRGKLEDVAFQLSELRTKYRIVLVSSGAIATASVHRTRRLGKCCGLQAGHVGHRAAQAHADLLRGIQ